MVSKSNLKILLIEFLITQHTHGFYTVMELQ